MMYINGEGWERSWHVGTPISLTVNEADSVYYVQADGDELAHIVNLMPNIPVAMHKRVNRWFGDIAKFIAANL